MEEIKKGFNIYWYYWTALVFLALFCINYFLRNFKIETLDISLMLSVVTFLFGFLVSITFSLILMRASSLKEALSQETGRFVSLYLLSKNLGEKFHNAIRERIDDYTVRTLKDYINYEVGRDADYGMYEDAKFMEIKTRVQQSQADSFFYILGEFQPARERIEYLTSSRVLFSLKSSTYILGGILIGLLFLNRGDVFTNALFVVLSTVIIFIFLIIEDYDDLKIGDYNANISNSEQLFDLIGKERYYPRRLLGRVELERGRNYRIGIYDPSIKGERVFTLLYNPSFKQKIQKIVLMFHSRSATEKVE